MPGRKRQRTAGDSIGRRCQQVRPIHQSVDVLCTGRSLGERAAEADCAGRVLLARRSAAHGAKPRRVSLARSIRSRSPSVLDEASALPRAAECAPRLARAPNDATRSGPFRSGGNIRQLICSNIDLDGRAGPPRISQHDRNSSDRPRRDLIMDIRCVSVCPGVSKLHLDAGHLVSCVMSLVFANPNLESIKVRFECKDDEADWTSLFLHPDFTNAWPKARHVQPSNLFGTPYTFAQLAHRTLYTSGARHWSSVPDGRLPRSAVQFPTVFDAPRPVSSRHAVGSIFLCTKSAASSYQDPGRQSRPGSNAVDRIATGIADASHLPSVVQPTGALARCWLAICSEQAFVSAGSSDRGLCCWQRCRRCLSSSEPFWSTPA
jgi:hypothetical protein